MQSVIKFNFLILSLFIEILLLNTELCSQSQQVEFESLTLEHGLSQTTVFSIIQDNTGYMWFGTIDGLNKFDGYTFTVYTNDPTDSNSISDDWISALYLDINGTLWIGTLRGCLNKFNPQKNSFENYQHNHENLYCINDNHIRMIFENKQGNCSIGRFKDVSSFWP